MASSLKRMILIALILSIAVPISTGHRENSENESDGGDDSERGSDDGDDSEIGHYLRDLCSDTKNSEQCWKIIKPEINRFTVKDSRNVACIVIDLAIAKSGEIKDRLNQLNQDSGDDALKEKYASCLNNYDDANHSLEMVKANLHSSVCQSISAQVDDVEQELKSCKHDFAERSVDPAHIRDRNKEFGHYMEIVRAAMNHVQRENDDSNALKVMMVMIQTPEVM